MKQPEKLKRDDQEATYGGGGSYGQSAPDYKPPMSASQMAIYAAWFIAGLIIGLMVG